MRGRELLDRAYAAGVRVRVEGDELVVSGPRSAEALARELLEYDAEVGATLEEGSLADASLTYYWLMGNEVQTFWKRALRYTHRAKG